MEELFNTSIDALNKKGVSIRDIADVVYELQKDYSPITMEM